MQQITVVHGDAALVADKRGELVHGAKGAAPRSLLEEYASPTSSQPPPATVRAGADLSELCQVIHKKAAGTGRPKRETKRFAHLGAGHGHASVGT